jgi:repressor LexA
VVEGGRVMNVGIKIKELREAKGMTQTELAQKVGYNTPSAINKIESGLRDLNQSKIMLFASALGVKPSELFGEKPDDEIIITDAFEEDIINRFRKLTNKQKISAYRQINEIFNFLEES